MIQDVLAYLPTYRRIHGWFAFTDLVAFDAVLDAQAMSRVTGDVLEIGVMHGKSAMFLARRRSPVERLYLCDLFETRPPETENAEEIEASYPGVTRSAFDHTALALGVTDLTILQMPSSQLGREIPPRSLRFAHIDGGHLYDQVSADVQLILELLLPEDGWVAFDDIRTAHAPGVAAAVWPVLANGDLDPVLITPTKLYAARRPRQSTLTALQDRLIESGMELENQQIFGHVVTRVVEPLDTSPYGRPSVWNGEPVFEGRARRRLRSLAGKIGSGR